MKALPPAEKRRYLALRLDLPVTASQAEDELTEQIQQALAGPPSPWELALCERLKIASEGLTRQQIRERLYLKANTPRSKLNKACQEIGQQPAFADRFATIKPRLKKGIEVLTWANTNSRTISAVHGNGRVQFKGKSSSVHATAIQCVLTAEDSAAEK